MKLNRTFHVSIRALYDGRCTFEEFKRSTGTVWTGLAAYLRRRWVPPPSVSVADVEQELLFWAWQFTPQWNPNYPDAKPLAEYVIWNACNKAKYMLHQQRGANLHGNHDANPSRMAIPFSALRAASGSDGDAIGDTANRFAAGVLPNPAVNGPAYYGAQHPPRPDDNIDRRRLVESAMVGTAPRVCAAMAALATAQGSIEIASAMLYDDTECRAALRLGSEKQAKALVRKAARVLIKHYKAA